MDDLLHMGGYARFVWPAFAATLLVLGGLLIASVRALRANETRLAELDAVGRSQPGETGT
ncbi:MAG: heme exporter protein CcmD [Rhodospirillales bacterium]|jgi:heme exporter protein D|nr:heme exporter protein CcmD [Rhodospirillales bacterium]